VAEAEAEAAGEGPQDQEMMIQTIEVLAARRAPIAAMEAGAIAAAIESIGPGPISNCFSDWKT
jgi:hypothetical protein